MPTETVSALLAAVYDPACGLDHKRTAEQQLNAFSKTTEALEWAHGAIQSPNVDPQQHFFAASVLEAAAIQRWHHLPPQHQAALRSCLWLGAIQPAAHLPPFAVAKLRAGFAYLACADWQLKFWDDINQACSTTTDGTSTEAAIRLIAATLEQLYSMAQGTTVGLNGKVLSSQIPTMQARLKEAYVMALHLLCPILEHNSPTRMASRTNQHITVITLEALRTVLLASPPGPSDQNGEIASKLIKILLPFLSLIAAPSPENTQIASLAMACIEELLNKPLVPEAMVEIQLQLLPALSGVSVAWLQQSAGSSANAHFLPLDPDSIASYTRLLLQTLKRGLDVAEKRAEVATAIQVVLRNLTEFAQHGKSPIAVLAATESWHAVLSHLEDLDAATWGTCEDNLDGEGPHTPSHSNTSIGSAYKKGVLHVTSLLLAPFFPGHLGLPTPPFLLNDLDASEGSGAALEDWIIAVGGDGGSEDMDPGSGAAEEESMLNDQPWDDIGIDDDLEITRIMSSRATSSNSLPLSEIEIFAQQAEYFIARALSNYKSDLIPQILNLLGPGMAATTQAMGENRREGQFAYLTADFTLRLVARCAPLLPATAMMSSPGPLEQGVSGAHALQLINVLLKFSSDLMSAIDDAVKDARTHQNQQANCVILLRVGSTAFKTLSPLMTTWLPQVLLKQSGADDEIQGILIQIISCVLDSIAGGLMRAATITSCFPQGSGVGKGYAMAAAQTFLSLTSIALSSGMRPPVQILHAVSASPAVASLATAITSGVHGQSGLPPAVLRPLGVGLSDLALRSWGTALQAKEVQIEGRKAAFTALMGPIVQVLTAAATAGAASSGASFSAEALPQLCLTTMIATDIVNSYNGTSKAIRGAAYVTLVEPSLVAVVLLLKSLRTASGGEVSMANSRLGSALLRFISSCLQSFPTELGTAGIGELLSTLVAVFSVPNPTDAAAITSDAAFAADVAVLSIIKTALAQGWNKHQALVQPAMEFGLQLWEKAAKNGATHIKANVLAALMNIMHNHWRSLAGSDAGPAPSAALVLTHLSTFLSDSAEVRVVPSSSDVRLVLEELFDLQSVTKVYWKPYFTPMGQLLMDSLLAMLLTRMYTGAQDYLIDTLYGLASANWSAFLLGFIPAFTGRRLAGLGPHGTEVASVLGVADMDPSAFEKAILSFVNDAVYWERCM